jgi:hypothetical protein
MAQSSHFINEACEIYDGSSFFEHILEKAYGWDIINQMTPTEATALSVVSRSFRKLTQPYHALVCFAASRPRLSGEELPLQTWEKIWADCAASAQEHGLEVSAWAYALNWDWPHRAWVECWDSPGDTVPVHPKLAGDLLHHPLIDPCDEEDDGDTGETRISNVLALRGWSKGDLRLRDQSYETWAVCALVLLSNSQYAVIYGDVTHGYGCMVAFLGDSVSLPLGDVFRWALNEEGYLYLDCEEHAEELNNGYCWSFTGSMELSETPDETWIDPCTLFRSGRKRTDKENGEPYTRREFEERYGDGDGSVRWAAAASAPRHAHLENVLKSLAFT